MDSKTFTNVKRSGSLRSTIGVHMRQFLTPVIAGMVALLISSAGHAEIKTEVTEYKQGGTSLQGFLAYDASVKGKRPAILIVHDWMGMGDYVKDRAKEFASKGYVAFAVDIYGKDGQPKDQKEAASTAGKYKDNRKLMRERAKAAFDLVKAKSFVDGNKIVAIGYCCRT
ncbi:MAG: hypothetical protein EOP06_19210, partial [Proteobacteria bacterium]